MRLEIKDFGKCPIRCRQLYKQKETAGACRFFLFINHVSVYAFVPVRVCKLIPAICTDTDYSNQHMIAATDELVYDTQTGAISIAAFAFRKWIFACFIS